MKEVSKNFWTFLIYHSPISSQETFTFFPRIKYTHPLYYGLSLSSIHRLKPQLPTWLYLKKRSLGNRCGLEGEVFMMK